MRHTTQNEETPGVLYVFILTFFWEFVYSIIAQNTNFTNYLNCAICYNCTKYREMCNCIDFCLLLTVFKTKLIFFIAFSCELLMGYDRYMS